MPTPEEITRHHDDGEVIHVGAHPTGYVVRIKQPVVREIYDRMFRAAGLLRPPDLTTSPASSSTGAGAR